MIRCICCGKPGQFSVLLFGAPNGDGRTDERYYIPNQSVRKHEKIPERWFCGAHMRAVEDSMRATILYHQTESGEMLVRPASS
jgi:hypothetical protein